MAYSKINGQITMKQTTAKAQAKTISKTTGRVKGTWGGRRPGAGRKPLCDKAMTETATVRLRNS